MDESRITLAWVNRTVADGSLRTSYEFAERTGDSYDYFPYEAFYSTSVEGYVPAPGAHPFTVAAMRKYDLSNRRQHKFRSIFIHPVGLASTASMLVHGQWNDYGAEIGRQEDRSAGLTLQWDYQPSPTMTIGAYAGGTTRASISPGSTTTASTPTPDRIPTSTPVWSA